MLIIEKVICQHNANRYIKFIKSRIKLNTYRDLSDVYIEKHHIIPRSLGGSDDENNIVELTFREHFIAHIILYNIYKSYNMLTAINIMSGNYNHNSKLYEYYKNEYRKQSKGFMTLKHHITHEYIRMKIDDPRYLSGEYIHILKGSTRSEETKCKLRESQLGEKSWRYGFKISEITRAKISGINNVNYKKSPSKETRLKMSIAQKGRLHGPMSEEIKRKIGDAQLGEKNHMYGKKVKDHRTQWVSINGIISTMSEAKDRLNVTRKTIAYRCGSHLEKWNDWNLIDK